MGQIHPEAGAEQGKGDQQQQDALVPAALHQKITLSRRGEDQHGNGGHDEDQHAVGEVHVDEQQVGIEDEEERQRCGAQAVVEGGETGTDGIPF